MKRLAILTSLWQVTLIDAMVGMMTSTVNDVTIVGTIIAVGLEAAEVARGISLRGYLNYRLQSD
jgi:hypothetical protein